jgi:Domain of unknown function (DUF4166)
MSTATLSTATLINLARSGRGTFVVERGPSSIARLIARIAGLATDGMLNVSMSVHRHDNNQATWHRTFGVIHRSSAVRVKSRCRATTSASLIESVGPLHITLSVDNTSIAMARTIELRSTAISFGTHRHGIAIPLRWAPTILCCLTNHADRQLVDVTINSSARTLIVRYLGAIA